MERFEIFTICRRPPVLQTDASVGMMKIVVRETKVNILGKKLACCPQQELRTMHSDVFTPHPLMPSKFEKTRPSRKAPEPIAKW